MNKNKRKCMNVSPSVQKCSVKTQNGGLKKATWWKEHLFGPREQGWRPPPERLRR